MDSADPVVLYTIYKRKYGVEKKKRPQRLYWTHPMISDRFFTGHFYLKHPQLQKYPDKFFNYYRMSKSSFEELVHKLRGTLLREHK
jgi:hypothetical protein